MMRDVRHMQSGMSWLEQFRRVHGQAPRILHIGNIANNAYKNARLLNEVGLDCDVICYDYYHIMGCPEWEEADIKGSIGDQFNPDWTAMDLGGYSRPKWFAQGPLRDCIKYLLARRRKENLRAEAIWWRLRAVNKTRPRNHFESLLARLGVPVARARRLFLVLLHEPNLIDCMARSAAEGFIRRHFRTGTGRILAVALICLSIAICRIVRKPFLRQPSAPQFVSDVVMRFHEAFPERSDSLTALDLLDYLEVPKLWRELLDEYDIVQAYATDPILPMLAGKRPYVAFEHGTLRDFALADNLVSRLNALAYNQADHVFITNGDCLDYAKKIGVTRYTPMIHPIDEAAIGAAPALTPDVRTQVGARYVFLCTLRHDWAVKGTDKYIRALPGIADVIGSNFMLFMVNWGAELESSRRLATELGVAASIHWIEPLPKHALARMLKSADILFDQIALPHFGGTAPEGIAAGVPVIMSYDPRSTDWIVSEPAPVLPAWSVEEIVENVRTALDPEWRANYQRRAAEWIERCHCSSIVVERHLSAYASLGVPCKAAVSR
jgi:glycosyltransferase involved in cell wall biosynthesis